MVPPASRRPDRRAKPFARAVPPGSATLMQRKQEVVRLALAAAAEGLFASRGFERTTVEQIARAAGVSRRTFFRYFESKEDVLAQRADRLGEYLYEALVARPSGEAPLLAIRNALVPALESGLRDADAIRCVIGLLRENNSLRRVVMARTSRMEERVAALMTRRLGVGPADNTPMLLAFLTRALLDTAFNAWYDHETDDLTGLVDDLFEKLAGLVPAAAAPPAARTAPAAASPVARPRTPPATRRPARR